jgi:cytidylate kinase
LDINDKAVLQKMFVDEREKRGESFLSDELINRVALLHPRYLVIEGNRRLVDYEGLKKLSKVRKEPFIFIFIDASPETRFKRYNAHPAEHGYKPVSRKEFDELEKNPAEDEISLLSDIAKKDGVYLSTDDNNEDSVMKAVYEAIDKN